MPIYDISVPLSASTPTYPGDPGIEITDWSKLAHGDPANVSSIKFGTHTGTHVDAPAHFIEGGPRIDSLSFEALLGEAYVIEVPKNALVIDEALVAEQVPPRAERILFKTRNSGFWGDVGRGFRSDYTYLEANAAQKLVALKIRLVGIDYLSIEEFKSESFETHQILLAHGVIIVEGLDLRDVPAGRYELFCLPLRITEGSGDGAPARAVLRTL